MNELQEFYPYVEMPAVAKNPDRFKGSFKGRKFVELPQTLSAFRLLYHPDLVISSFRRLHDVWY
jgi:hypothetical protein